VLIFGESYSLYVWGAMGLTLAGVALVNARQPKRAGSASPENALELREPGPRGGLEAKQ